MGHWYYGQNGQQIGPVDDQSMRMAIQEGTVRADTLVWRDGMSSWLPLVQVPELSGAAMAPSMNPYHPPVYQPVYGQGAATSGLAIASLVCGIAGLVTCLFIVGIPAVICGHMALKQINESAVPVGGRGMAISGLIMGYLQVIACLAIVVFFIIGINSR